VTLREQRYYKGRYNLVETNQKELSTKYRYCLFDGVKIHFQRDVLAHKTSLTPPLLIEMPVLIQESERWSCICVLEVMYLCIVGIYFAPFYDFDDNQIRTIQRNRQHWVHKTKKNKTKPQHNMHDTTTRKQTRICVLEVMYLCIVGIYFAPFYDFDT
jgi:uncharacterized membrane protein